MSTQSLIVALQAGEMSLGELVHPNKMPFEGIMTWLNIPSDKPVGGAKGKRVVITEEYGLPGLASLKGMAVNFDNVWMDKHISTNKIGMIEDCWAGEALETGAIPVYVKGYIFAHDFPEEAAQIKEEQATLGFSYETVDTAVIDGIYEGETVLMACADVMFSGAAILLKNKAAYTNTSLVAQAEEVLDLEMEKIVEAVMLALTEKYELKAKAEEVPVVETPADEAETVVESIVEPVVEVTEPVVETVVETPVVETVTETPVVEEPTVELTASAEETIDFKAQSEDLTAKLEAANATIEKMKADFKAEADGVNANSHKGFAYPTTLVAKYNLDASADTYEGKIAAVDARTDLSSDERMALKFELRTNNLKSQK